MKLSGKTRLTIEIDPVKFLHAPHDRKNLAYLGERFCSGEETALQEFEVWGITISEEAT